MAVLLAGACVAAVPGQVRLQATSPHALEPSALASDNRSPRLAGTATSPRSSPPAQTPSSIVKLSELAPAEAEMILTLPVLQDTREVATGSSEIQAMPGANAALVAENSPVSPATFVGPASPPPRFDEVMVGQRAAAPELLRPVDIEQIADSEARSLRMAQLREPGLAAGGGPTLAARVDAMQIALPPPPRLRDAERAALLTESPSHLLVRIGDSPLGNVALRTSDGHGFDVQLSGLLDLLADRFDSSEFERMRASAAADTFVSFDQLRAMGLNLRYDPVYDELRITG